jgi:hypothetical protein
VIVLIAILSVDSICSIVPWCGELIDLVLGRRVALAGSDWVRIGLTVGGAALSLRLLTEVRHSKLAIAMMAAALLFFAIPMASRWGVVGVDTPGRWLVVTSSPLLAAATLWVACGAYLRKLFREVRKLDEDDSVSLRVRQWQEQWKGRFAALRADKRKESLADEVEVEPRRKATVKPSVPAKPRTAVAVAETHGNPSDGSPAVKKSRFSLRLWPKKTAGESTEPGETEKQSAAKPIEPPRPAVATAGPAVAKPQASPVVNKATPEKTGSPAGDDDPQAKSRRKWFSGWFARTDKPVATEKSPVATSKTKPAVAPAEGDDDDADSGDDPSIDWASMGKAERRRLRREMKRGGQAA